MISTETADRHFRQEYIQRVNHHRSAPRDETAIWGRGSTNSLVAVLKAMFTWQLDGDRE